MKQFASIEKLDTAILYVLELSSSLSVLLLAFGLIASMANALTKGSVLTNHAWAQEVWAWTQCIAIDASVAGAIIRTFQYRKEQQWIKMWLYTFLSILLLFTAAIVSNIESVQQTLNIALDQAYKQVVVPLELLIWIRSIAIVCLIVAHALRHVDLSESTNVLANVVVESEKEEDRPPSGEITQLSPQHEQDGLKTLPLPKIRSLVEKRKQEAEKNKHAVLTYFQANPAANITEAAKALTLSIPTVRKRMQNIRDTQ